MKVRIGSAAYSDLEAIHEWYRGQSPQLEVEFREELKQVLHRIQLQPTAFPYVNRTVRRARLRRFPHGVFYKLREDDLLILAVLHVARAPRTWKERSW